MRTMRKQFPVNWLTSGGEAESKNKKKWWPKWRDFELIKMSYFNEETTTESG